MNTRISLFQLQAWMTPLADVMIFLGLAIALLILGRRFSTPLFFRIAGFVFGFFAFLSILFRFSWLATYAALLLAAGLGIQCSRWMAPHAQKLQRLVSLSLPWLVGVVLALAGGVHAKEYFQERQLIAKLPPAATKSPNVLLIVMDTVRAENLSLHGYKRQTSPQLERLAKRGVVFNRAVATASWTLPSHASIFTGLYLNELPKGWTRLTDSGIDSPALAETLSQRGYTTGAFVANLIACDRDSGLERGFVRYEDYPISLGQIALSSALASAATSSGSATKLRRLLGGGDLMNRKTAASINEDFLSWLNRQEERPFFAFINYFDAHSPYLPPAPFSEKFGPRPKPKALMKVSKYLDRLTTDGAAAVDQNLDQEQLAAQLSAYDSAIAYVDHHVGLLLDQLEKRRVLENTLVIITSDHGEEFGEHGVFGHGWNLQWLSVHVPLLVLFPSSIPANKIVNEPVSLRDIEATVRDLTNIKGQTSSGGASLARYWDGRVTNLSESGALSELGGHRDDSKWTMKSLTVGRYHYIRHGNGREELFDTESDALGERNLAETDEGRRVCERFRWAQA
jgi:arylsulfatase A-like enzyme